MRNCFGDGPTEDDRSARVNQVPAVIVNEGRSVVLPRLQVPLKMVAKSVFRLDTIMALGAIIVSAIMISTGVFSLSFFQDPSAPLNCFSWNYAVMAAYAWGLGGYLNHVYGGKLVSVGYDKHEVLAGTEKPYDGGLIPARFVICLIFCATSVAFAWAAFETPSWNLNYSNVLIDFCFAGIVSAVAFVICYSLYAHFTRADIIASKSVKRMISGRFTLAFMGFAMNLTFAIGLWRIVIDYNESALQCSLPCLFVNIGGCIGAIAVFACTVSRSQDRGIKPSEPPR